MSDTKDAGTYERLREVPPEVRAMQTQRTANGIAATVQEAIRGGRDPKDLVIVVGDARTPEGAAFLDDVDLPNGAKANAEAVFYAVFERVPFFRGLSDPAPTPALFFLPEVLMAFVGREGFVFSGAPLSDLGMTFAADEPAVNASGGSS
jgi:hypothetical protein